jgi:hypothetical protein
MTLDDDRKNRKEVVQIYLLIITLLIAIKQISVPQNFSTAINQTNATIATSTGNPQTSLLYCFLLLFVLMVLNSYITSHNNQLWDYLFAIVIGTSFSMIVYFCLFEQMIKTDVLNSLVFSEIVIGIVLFIRLGKAHIYDLKKWLSTIASKSKNGLTVNTRTLIVYSFISILIVYGLYTGIKDFKSTVLVIIILLMEIITTLGFVASAKSSTSTTVASQEISSETSQENTKYLLD